MFSRLACAIALCFVAILPASAQTVRFDTNVGTFDMELNPTGNPNLQPHVNNLLSYVNAGRYNLTAVNRAAEGFVLQMGGFRAPFLTVPESFNEFPSVESFDPVIVDEDGDGAIDFDTSNLNNTRGTVTLALSSPQNMTDPNSGTSSFFANIGDNTSLDASGFIPFAEISNMATIDLIMALEQVSLNDNNLAASDIPILDGNQLVIIEQAFVVRDSDDDDMEEILNEASGSGSNPPNDQVESSTGVPEPTGLALALNAIMLLASRRRAF